MEAHIYRTKIIGGGTGYDVLIPCHQKSYRPISFGTYATIVSRATKGNDFKSRVDYYYMADFLRTPEIDALPALSDERWNAFKRLEVIAASLSYQLALKAFPELASVRGLPFLWADWSLPSDMKIVAFTESYDPAGFRLAEALQD